MRQTNFNRAHLTFPKSFFSSPLISGISYLFVRSKNKENPFASSFPRVDEAICRLEVRKEGREGGYTKINSSICRG